MNKNGQKQNGHYQFIPAFMILAVFILFSLGYVFVSVKTDPDVRGWIGPGILMAGFIGVAILRFYL